MSDYDENDELLDEEELAAAKKKKKGEGEKDRQGRETVQVSEGFYAYMASIGASKSLVAEILRGWRHLRGEGLLRAISDLAKRASSRATAHVEVQVDSGRGFAVVHNFVTQFFKKAPPALTHKRTIDPGRQGPK